MNTTLQSSFDLDEIMRPSLPTRLRKAMITVMSDRRTSTLAPTVCMGQMSIDDDVPTACTDGRDTWYGSAFCEPLTFKQLVYLVLHEELHKLTMDLLLCADLFAQDAQLANVACDHANNIVIETAGIDDLIERPPGALVNMKFKGWSKHEIFHFLKTGTDKDGKKQGEPKPNGQQSDGNGGLTKPSSVTIGNETFSLTEMDALDPSVAKGLSKEEQQELHGEVQRSIQQAILMAGMQGMKLPRTITDAVAPEADWRAILQEFVSCMVRGEDELTYRRYDRRYLDLAPGNELFLPTTINERIGTLLICMDASGSTYGEIFDEFVAAFQNILTASRPERVRILHWDVGVTHDQEITEDEYLGEDLKQLLTPVGGGGTNISSVSDYIITNGTAADCCIIFTDGYIEDKPRWQPRMPTLWMVTRKENFTPPAGQMVHIK